MIVVSHDVEFVRGARRPTGCCSCPKAPLDYYDDSMLGFVELA